MVLVGSTEGIKGIVLFVTLAYVARVAGAELFGIIAFGQGLLTYFLFLGHAGLDMLGARVVARDPEGAETPAGAFVALKAITGVLGFACAVIVILLLKLTPLARTVALLFAGTVLVLPFLTDWYFYGRQRLGILLAGRAVSYAAMLGGTLLLVRSPAAIVRYPIIYVASTAAGAVVLLVAFVAFERGTKLTLQWKQARALLRTSLPLGLSFLFTQVLLTFSILALTAMVNPETVGIYAAAQKIAFGVLHQGGVVLGLAFYPLLSRAFAAGRPQFRRMFRYYLAAAVMAAIAVSLIGFLWGRPIIVLIYSAAYAQSAPAFSWLCLAVALDFLDGPFTYSMLATKFEDRVLVRTGCMAALNVVLHLVLVPRYGINGAVWANLCSALFGLTLSVAIFRISFGKN
jgi:O-antigen/teichoic acid export membrane protein